MSGAGFARALAALAFACVPSGGLRSRLFALIGWSVDPAASIGLSWVEATEVRLGPAARIGHGCRIGPLARLDLGPRSLLGSRTRVAGNAEGEGRLEMNEGAAIVAHHFVDAGGGVEMGRFATLAGRGSQLWTHGWKAFGEDGKRTSGSAPVRLADDAYVGSGAVLLPGVELAERVTIGAGAVVGPSAAARCEAGGTLIGNPARPPG